MFACLEQGSPISRDPEMSRVIPRCLEGYSLVSSYLERHSLISRVARLSRDVSMNRRLSRETLGYLERLVRLLVSDLSNLYNYSFMKGVSMASRTRRWRCVLCGELTRGFGNNAAPLADGSCCDVCNYKVLSTRFRRMLREMTQ